MDRDVFHLLPLLVERYLIAFSLISLVLKISNAYAYFHIYCGGLQGLL